MTTNSMTSREHYLAADQGLSDGIKSNKGRLPASFPVGAKTYTPDDVAALLDDRVAAGKAVVTADAARTAAVKTEREKRAETKLVVDTFRRLAVVLFMQSPDILAEFALRPPKVPERTAESKAKAAEKSKATRKLLGTKGRKQKKAVLAAAKGAPTSGSAGEGSASG
jgi:hypothetical protein